MFCPELSPRSGFVQGAEIPTWDEPRVASWGVLVEKTGILIHRDAAQSMKVHFLLGVNIEIK